MRATANCGCVEAVGIDQVQSCTSKSDGCCKADYAVAYLPVTLTLCNGCAPNIDSSATPSDTDESLEADMQALWEGFSTDPDEELVLRDAKSQSSTRAVHTYSTSIPLPSTDLQTFNGDDTMNAQQTLSSRRQMRTQFVPPAGFGNLGGA